MRGGGEVMCGVLTLAPTTRRQNAQPLEAR